MPSAKGKWPFRGWVGLTLVVVFWVLNWSLTGLRTHWGFFPLWLGYCLTVDAMVFARRGTSLWQRSRWGFVGLFVVSAPSWWLFEVINWRTGNWCYQGREAFSDLEYLMTGSLSFSTVIPAVFGTAELASTLGWIRRLPRGRRFHLGTAGLAALVVVGVLMMVLLLGWPLYFFPLLWISLFCMLDPLNDLIGNRSLFRYVASGDWRPLVALSSGCLVCGFFWEMWNFFSYPKWIYVIPYVDFLKVFEMPILGYGGYIPFALELFALYHFVAGALKLESGRSLVQISVGGTQSAGGGG
jgi:hypothetical protein